MAGKKDQYKSPPFIKLPEYPGGKEALEKFFMENLKYPDEALKNKIEGLVHIAFDVDHNGKVSNPKIIHGLGYGCDEEAIRLVSLLKFTATYNRGMRLKKTMKFRIPFKIKNKGIKIQYELSNQDNQDQENQDTEDKDQGTGYGYTIRF